MTFLYLYIMCFDYIYLLCYYYLSSSSSLRFPSPSTSLVVPLLHLWPWFGLVFFPFSFHKWKKTCDPCCCGIGLFHLTWCFLVPSIFPTNDISSKKWKELSERRTKLKHCIWCLVFILQFLTRLSRLIGHQTQSLCLFNLFFIALFFLNSNA
jgi:hypothetical protein